eukprot:EG_transcript_11067
MAIPSTVIVPAEADTDLWCQQLIADCSVQMRASDSHGRGLYAARPIPEGAVLWTEQPLLGHQLYANAFDVLLCRHCLRPLRSLGHQLRFMAEGDAEASEEGDDSDGEDDDDDEEEEEEARAAELNSVLPLLAPGEAVLSAAVSCEACGETFCSPTCRDEARRQYHRVTCGCPEKALDAFTRHALEWDEIFVAVRAAVERVIAGVLEGSASSTDPAEAERIVQEHLRPFWSLCYIPWPELEDADSPTQGVSARRRACARSAALLHRCIVVPLPSACEMLFEAETYARLAGALALNNVCISFPSPQQQYYELLQRRCPALPGLLTDTLARIVAVQRLRHTGWDPGTSLAFPHFPEVEGTGLFPRLALLNHSCVPSASYEFVGNHSLLLIATRPLAAGDEVTIAYCDETLSAAQRQAELAHWHFRCSCSACGSPPGATGMGDPPREG